MPFVKKTNHQASQLQNDTRRIFIGRESELLFFVQNILKPEEPTHNIISIWGQGGVGKSTLLARFIDEAQSADFKDYCLTATVNELQTSPASMMGKFANQLHMQGTFEKVLKQYKEALSKLQTDREMAQDTVLQKIPSLAGAAIEGVPLVGPLLGEGVRESAEHLLGKYHNHQKRKEAERLEDPIDILSRAFVEELNGLTDSQVFFGAHRGSDRRVILFFDTFEQLAATAVFWLLDYFLPANISNNVVLVIAGRDSLDRSIPGDTKRWLPYQDNETIYWIPLNSFTQEETRAYLMKRNITDPDRITTIWQLSQGLPLYLSLLTSNLHGKVDPTADVVANFLRWIPEREQIKRQLALDASLFSRPFNQDDLAAFTYLPQDELPSLYRWIVAQPFVHPQEGRYSYHDLARELFSRHLYQRSKKEYYATRRALAKHYQQLLEEIQVEEEREAYNSTEWLELALEVVHQLLLLPDAGSHGKAIEQVLIASEYTKQTGEIARVLRELSDEHFNSLVNSSARQIARHLLQLIEAELRSEERLLAASYLLEKVSSNAAFPQELLAHLYRMRAISYTYLYEYQRAIEDCDRAIQLDPQFAWAYINRGYIFRRLQEYQLAVEDFNRALELNPNDAWAYASRSLAYGELNEYQRAIEDCDRAIQLDPKYAWAYVCRSIAFRELHENQRAIEDCNRALLLDANYPRAYFHRSIAYTRLKMYQLAIEDCNHALELDPKDTWAYIQRGFIYRQLEDYHQAIENFEYAIELDPNEAWAYAQRGITYRILEQYELALADFDRTIALSPRSFQTYRRRGFIYLLLKDIRQAQSNYAYSWEHDPAIIYSGWMVEWTDMCQERPDLKTAERLERIAVTNPERYAAYVCRGVAMWLREYYEKTLAELERAIQFESGGGGWDAYFWKGMTYASLGREEEAMLAIEKALERELPPVLLAPLHWFEQERPDFFQKYAAPLLARYDLL